MRKFLICLYICAPLSGVAQEPVKVTLVSDFWEVVHPVAQIGGARVVGFAAIGALGLSENDSPLVATLPRDWAGELTCLKVMSADGLYESQNTYSVSQDWTGGAVALDYPSREFERLSNLPLSMLAALMLRGGCEIESSEASQVAWGQVGPQDGTFQLFLNTSRADETFVYFPNYPDVADISCTAAVFDGRSAFDAFCDLPKELARLGKVQANIVSFKGGEMGRDVELTLHLGSPDQ
jgi:hypothetical protein